MAKLNDFIDVKKHLENFFSWRALKEIQKESTAREFGFLLLGILLLRAATSFVSIGAGSFFFRAYFATVLYDPAAVWFATVLFLICIELVAMGFMGKFFKFLYAKRWGQAAAMFAGVVLFFVISFHTSTEGIKQYKTNTDEIQTQISVNYQSGVDSIAYFYNQQLEECDRQIRLLNRWENHSEIGQQKIALMQAKNEALKEYAERIDQQRQDVDKKANQDGENYWLYVSAIMILQLVCNGVLIFTYGKIYHENHPDKETEDNLGTLAHHMADNATTYATNIFNTAVNNFYRSFEMAFYRFNERNASKEANDQDGGPIQAPEVVAVEGKPHTAPAIDQAPTAPPIVTVRTSKPLPKPQKPIGFNTDTGNTDSPTNYGPVVEPQNTDTDTAKHGNADTAKHGNTDTATRTTAKGLAPKVCPFCGETFTPKTWNQVYCCPKHKDAFWNNNGLDVEAIKMRNSRKK